MVHANIQIDGLFMHGIYDLPCNLDRVFLTTTLLEVDHGTLTIMEDTMRIVVTCIPVIGNRNIEAVSSPIFLE